MHEFMKLEMPIWDSIHGETKHRFVHSTLKIEKDACDVEYSKITGSIVKSVLLSFFYLIM